MRDIFRTFVKAGIGSGLNLILALARNKLLAITLGPQGIGLLALLQQIQATALPIATLGGDAPLVQGLASRNGRARDEFLASAALGLISVWILCLTVFFVVLPFWTGRFFSDENFISSITLKLMALPVVLAALVTVFSSLLTTVGAVGTLQKSQLIGNFFGLVAALPLAYFWQTSKTLHLVIYLMATPSCGLIAAVFFSIRLSSSRNLLKNFSIRNSKLAELKSYLQFGATTLFTGLIVTATWLAIRGKIFKTLGSETLGQFSSVVSLSGLSLTLFGTALSSFYMPKFAAASAEERPKLVVSMFKLVAPLAFVIFLTLSCYPKPILKILYSENFTPAASLLVWWSAGDFLRTISYIFSYTIFAGRHLKFALVCETTFSLLLLFGLTSSIQSSQSLEKMGVIYFSIYTFYLCTVVVFARIKGYVRVKLCY